jgi:regulator of sigma E protease
MILTIVSFIVVLSILVFIHELGHYLAARHVGVRVQRFSIGFPPRLWGKTVGETEYMLSWIPLGGYVKLEGQNLDDENPKDPRNYASKTKWQRVYILVAGPAMNLAAAFVLMAAVYMIGVEVPRYRLDPALLSGVRPDSAADKAGLRAGDRVVKIGTEETPTWGAVEQAIGSQGMAGGELRLTVLRDGKPRTLTTSALAFAAREPFGWKPLVAPVVGTFSANSPAKAAGLDVGDRILAIGGAPVTEWEHMPAAIQKSQGKPIALDIDRAGKRLKITVTPRHQGGAWLIGVSPGTNLERHGFVDALREGGLRLGQITAGTFSFLGQLLTGRGSLDALGGPVKIGQVIGDAARVGLDSVLFLMAVISLQLGIFNLLPIPALDGGHIMLLGVEALARRPLSARVRERAQMIGFSLLLLLILVVTYNDVMGLIS